MVSIVTAYRDLVRLREIYVVLVKHGFGELASRLGLARRPRKLAAPRDNKESDAPPPSERGAGDALVLEASADEVAQGEQERAKISLAERVRLVAQDLGPSFVKLGQIASTRPDILPPDLVMELKKLQDAVPPVPYEDIRRQIESSLARSVEEVYEWFQETPLAAASIGQVHRASLRTPDGPLDVVVKVQRPGVAQTIARDLELLHTLAVLIERTIPESKLYAPVALVENFDRSITAELDYTIEADNARRFAKNFEGNPSVKIPAVYREATARTVLTQEFLPGRKVYDAIAHGHSGPLLAKKSVGIIIKQVFEDGFFHADPHPGNLMVLGEPADPVIGIIDLGMVGRLSPDMRDKTIDLMIAAVVRQDPVGVADALYAIGSPTRKVDMRAYRAEVSMLAEKYLGRQLKEIEVSKMLRDIIAGAQKYGIEIPPDFVLVGKAVMTIEGIGKEIDPDLDVFSEARPYFVEILRRRYSPERLMNDAWRGLEKLSNAAYELPQQSQEILEDLRLGRLQMKTVNPELPKALHRLGRSAFSGLVFASLMGSGSLLIATHVQPIALGVVLMVLALLVLLGQIVLDNRS